MLNFKNTKRIYTLTQNLKFSFFDFFKSKPPIEEKPKQDQWDSANWQNMGPLHDKILKANQHKPKVLPLQTDNEKLTVVMELDEVLLYVFSPDPRENWMTAPIRRWDYSVGLPEFETWIDIYKREHLDTFLEFWLRETEPVVWSCGDPAYVKLLMNQICPNFPQSHILTQKDCNLVEEAEETLELFVKDMNILGRDLSRVVYVDSKPLNFWLSGDNSKFIFQQSKGIPITVFTADNTDTHSRDDLLKLIDELKMLKQQANVRDYLIGRYRIEETQRDSKLIF